MPLALYLQRQLRKYTAPCLQLHLCSRVAAAATPPCLQPHAYLCACTCMPATAHQRWHVCGRMSVDALEAMATQTSEFDTLLNSFNGCPLM